MQDGATFVTIELRYDKIRNCEHNAADFEKELVGIVTIMQWL